MQQLMFLVHWVGVTQKALVATKAKAFPSMEYPQNTYQEMFYNEIEMRLP